ncbi:Crp/Fnr family transcriptional regulator [Sphingomonas rhizophila]|uniref:Crp/Fnr family transcriptional regulator n=1 Tax=Sphingomonas rhizophila TaxID=2071607 RepID=A0A7G9SB44_9SPHN|nr:Crp/Fnr family transcriptional regulator [Sphingomonas rhizophila]QNN65069.1 Crp/Fnr family transcriptional regulator [Sphingomonas rhizophila]
MAIEFRPGQAPAQLADFDENRLLKTFPEPLRESLIGQATIIHLEDGDAVHDVGEEVSRSLFPLGSAMISMLADIDNGRSIEVASIGREGAIGGIVSCGHSPAFAKVVVLMGGRFLSLPMSFLEESKATSGLLRNIFCRYSDYLLAQIMQTVACNAFHSIEERAARWLLTAQDRAGDRLRLTQEEMARLLGVQRTTINAVARELQEEGLIATRRGAIEIESREGLLRRSCACYRTVENFFDDIIGETGSGASDGCD